MSNLRSLYIPLTKKLLKLVQYVEPFKGCDNKFHYVYEIYVPFSNKYYCGVRSCNNYKTDEYCGSSQDIDFRNDIKQSNNVSFKIISFFDSRELANEFEEKIVTSEYIKRSDVYNKSLPSKKFGCYESVVVKTTDGITTISKEDFEKGDYKSINEKEVFQYNLKGELINKFDSLLKASKETNIEKTSISSCCRKIRDTAGGFIWRFNKEKVYYDKPKKYNEKKVYQYTKDMILVSEYESVAEASRQTGITNIVSCCNNKRKTAGKFIWTYNK